MQCTFSSYKKRLVKSHLRHGRHHHHKTYFGHCGYLWKSPAFAQVMWSGITKKPTSSNSCAMITALPLTNLAIQNMFATFTTTLALEAQWRLQTNVFAIKLPRIRFNLPKLPVPQSKGKQGQQSKVDGAVYVDDNPNANLFTKPKTTTPPSQVRVRAAGSPAKVPQAPTLDELKQRKGLEPTFTTKEGWKRFPARRRPGKDMEMFLNMSKEMNRGSS